MTNKEEIKEVKNRLAYWESIMDNAKMNVQACKRQLRELDIKAQEIRVKNHVRKNLNIMVSKQNTIFTALRTIGHRVPAGPICTELGKMGIKIESMDFGGVYKEAIANDSRIVVTKVNASKYEYSLKEWDNNQK